jgi:uncharacterized protein (DUF2235 family)
MSRSARSHVFIIDGTLSSLAEGCETHAGKLYRLLTEQGPRAAQSVGYHPGVQGRGWRRWWNAATGDGLNSAIRAGYSAIASRYRPGDKIYLFGYSRGAYAVRSLAGLIARVGLLRPNQATERRVRRAFNYYKAEVISPRAAAFRKRHCHQAVEIEMIGVWDTVKSLGPPLPILTYFGLRAVEFHDAELSDHIKAGYHALALDETRRAFRPKLWRRGDGENQGRVEQMWFPGTHGDVGGDQRTASAATQAFGHLSLNWLLSRADRHGLALPEDWRHRFPSDVAAPSIGSRRGIAKFFVLRTPRIVGDLDENPDGERLHESVRQRMAVHARYRPRGLINGAPLRTSTITALMVPFLPK